MAPHVVAQRDILVSVSGLGQLRGIERHMVQRLRRLPDWPAGIRIAPGARGLRWRLSEVDAFLERRREAA